MTLKSVILACVPPAETLSIMNAQSYEQVIHNHIDFVAPYCHDGQCRHFGLQLIHKHAEHTHKRRNNGLECRGLGLLGFWKYRIRLNGNNRFHCAQ